MWNVWPEFEPQMRTLDALRQRMDQAFAEAGSNAGTDTWQPRAVATETDAGYSLTLDVPGFADKDIQVTVHGNDVTIQGNLQTEWPSDWTAHRLERGNLNFARKFTLPTAIEADSATAAVQNGVLNVTLPKAAAARPRQISVATH
jgi:HSP20 family protein